jgi:hypothetical protein
MASIPPQLFPPSTMRLPCVGRGSSSSKESASVSSAAEIERRSFLGETLEATDKERARSMQLTTREATNVSDGNYVIVRDGSSCVGRKGIVLQCQELVLMKGEYCLLSRYEDSIVGEQSRV